MNTESDLTDEIAVPRNELVQNRRSALLGGAAVLLSVPALRSEVVFAADDPVAIIREARDLLDSMPAVIDAEEWDQCRTIIAAPPLGFKGKGSLKDNLDKAAGSLGGGLKGAAKGIAQDS